MKTCALCSENKPDEQFKSIPYFTLEDPKRKKVWCKICQSLWLRRKKEMKEPLTESGVKFEEKKVHMSFS
tara:strand:+ start:3761 stop:3970 length:210 start_codon:yes stop_codon:yes gene_type:complete